MNLTAKLTASVSGFFRDARGNVLILMGFALIPITIAAGMTVDYSRAARLKTKLDAAADAAVLAAVAEAGNTASDRTVCERAAALFNSQASGILQTSYSRITGITLTVGTKLVPANVSYVGTTNTCSSPLGAPSSAAGRVVALTYTIDSQNIFGNLLNRPSLPVDGRAGSEASIAPNIDFYVALDTSPSMALPVEAAGIATMTAKTGCTFACHTNKASNKIQDNNFFMINKGSFGTSTVGGFPITYIDANNTYIYTGNKKCAGSCTDDFNVYNADGSYVDTYWYAQNKNIVLRIDELRRATADLVTTALTEAIKSEATYRAAIYAFDYEANFRKIYPTDGDPVKTIAEKTPSMAVLANGIAFQAKANSRTDVDLAMLDDKKGNGCPAVGCTSSNRYLFTSFKGLLDGMSATGVLPAVAGNGTRSVGDTPQTFLFIVTDGMSDEKASLVDGSNSLGSDRTRSEITGSLPNPGTNTHMAKCKAIKARNISIAILYTEYTVASIASDEVNQRTYVTNRLTPVDMVESKLRDCASPGLMLKVSEGTDISASLQALFRKAIASPRLVR